MRLIIVTVGFSADLILRTLLKLGIRDEDTILLVYSRSGAERDVKRALRTIEDVEGVLGGLKTLINLEKLEVSASDFVSDVVKICRKINTLTKTRGINEVVGAFSGGMRLLILEALTALALYSRFNKKIKAYNVIVMREDGLYTVTIPLKLLTDSSLSPAEIQVLISISDMKETRRASIVASLSGKIARSTVYDAINSLEEKGLIEEENGLLRLTPMGLLYAEILKMR